MATVVEERFRTYSRYLATQFADDFNDEKPGTNRAPTARKLWAIVQAIVPIEAKDEA